MSTEPVTRAGKALLGTRLLVEDRRDLLRDSILAIEQEAQAIQAHQIAELREAIATEGKNHRIHSEAYQTLHWLDDLLATTKRLPPADESEPSLDAFSVVEAHLLDHPMRTPGCHTCQANVNAGRRS